MGDDGTARILPARSITLGWIRPARHPDLGVEVNGQSVVRHLRFGRTVRVERLELKPGAGFPPFRPIPRT